MVLRMEANSLSLKLTVEDGTKGDFIHNQRAQKLAKFYDMLFTQTSQDPLNWQNNYENQQFLSVQQKYFTCLQDILFSLFMG